MYNTKISGDGAEGSARLAIKDTIKAKKASKDSIEKINKQSKNFTFDIFI